MYENLTLDFIKSEILKKISSDIDIREGSFTNDMISAVSYEIWKLYRSLDALIPIAFIDETSGEYIDKRCAEYGIKRKPGVSASTQLTFTGNNGVVIPAHTVFMTADGYQFATEDAVTINAGAASVAAKSIDIGEKNNVPENSITRQIVNISGLSTISNTAATGGTDTETDEALVSRFYNLLQKPATSGNASHYYQWALSVNGVGMAKVIPLHAGAGTVKVIIAGMDKQPVSQEIIDNCQAYIEANRPIGVEVTVVSAEALTVNVSAAVTVDSTTTPADVQTELTQLLGDYLEEIAFSDNDLVYNRIAYMLLGIPGVSDYSSLLVNGGTSNITDDELIKISKVPVLGTVEVI